MTELVTSIQYPGFKDTKTSGGISPAKKTSPNHNMLPVTKTRKDTVISIVSDITSENGHKEEVLKKYATWAEDYDEDLGEDLYPAPIVLAKQALKMFSGDKGCYLLDVAAGTGKVAEVLKRDGFTNIDALDASAEMLEKAKKKGFYKKYIHAYIDPATPLPIKDDTYDGITMAGALNPGHLDGSCFPELIRITKKGGLIIFTCTESHNKSSNVWDYIENLEKGSKWETVDHSMAPCFNDKPGHLYTMRVN